MVPQVKRSRADIKQIPPEEWKRREEERRARFRAWWNGLSSEWDARGNQGRSRPRDPALDSRQAGAHPSPAQGRAALREGEAMKARARRFRLVVYIGADSKEAALNALRGILFSAESEGSVASVSGGWDSGHIWSVKEVNPGMTHEQYAEEDEAYCAWLRSGRPE